MNKDQLRVAASYFFWRDVIDSGESGWDENTDFEKPIPLYSIEEDVIAYYIKTVDENDKVNGYMVVNAFWDNPCVLEFGYGENIGNTIEKYRTSMNDKVYYATSGIYCSKDEYKKTDCFTKQSKNLSDALSTCNPVLKSKIEEIYNSQTGSQTKSNSEWGIIGLRDLPSGAYSVRNLYNVSGIGWSTTNDTEDDNNCGPTSGTNMLLYYEEYLNTTFVSSKSWTNHKLYNLMNTGSLGTSVTNYITGIKAYINQYYPSHTVTSSTRWSYSWSTLKSNINNNVMVAAYVWAINNLDGAHYINYIGWRQYATDGLNYVRVLNQWDTSTAHFILYDSSYTSRVTSTIKIVIS